MYCVNICLYGTKIAKIYNFVAVMHNVLYIHGMGGGGDSRIPSILADALSADNINVVVRTYDFDPEVAAEQSAFTSGLWAWVIAPGVAIFITVFGFMQIGYALEEILNPKMKRKKDKKKDGLSPEAAAAAVFAEIADISEEEAENLKAEFMAAEGKNG